MERGTFPKIIPAFDEFVVTQLNTDGRPKAEFNEALQIRLVGENSLPRYVILDPQSERVLRSWAYEIQFKSDPRTFAERLKDGHEAFKALR